MMAREHSPRGSRLAPPIMSRHAKLRSQQRVIPPFVIEALLDFGNSELAGYGYERFFFTKRSWKRFSVHMGPAAHDVERFRDVYIVVSGDGTVVTAAWRH